MHSSSMELVYRDNLQKAKLNVCFISSLMDHGKADVISSIYLLDSNDIVLLRKLYFFNETT